MVSISKRSRLVQSFQVAAFYLTISLQLCLGQTVAKQNVPAQEHEQLIALRIEGEMRPVVLPNAVQCDVTSSMGLKYRLFIDAPEGEAPADGWPVVYCTDGNENFGIVAQVVRRMSRSQSKAIVVGIGYIGESRQEYLKQRSFDLTFPAADEWLRDKLTILKDHKFGGAERFLDFLIDELRPWLASQHKIDDNKQTLLGHSFGGLFTLHAAMTRPAAFSGYVAISPSLWWADGALREMQREGLTRIATLSPKPRFFIAVGEHEQGPLKHVESPNVLNQSPMIEQAKDFAQQLTANRSGVKAQFNVVPNAHHGSVYIPAVVQGLAIILDQEPASGLPAQ